VKNEDVTRDPQKRPAEHDERSGSEPDSIEAPVQGDGSPAGRDAVPSEAARTGRDAFTGEGSAAGRSGSSAPDSPPDAVPGDSGGAPGVRPAERAPTTEH
jgi:hypothetical protein